jgi:hypothetical protein
VQPTSFFAPPPPVQQPRIPIWVVGARHRPKSMRRVLRYDALLPNVFDADGKPRLLTPDDVAAMRAFVRDHHERPDSFDIVVEGETPGEDPQAAADEVGPLAEAGMTWWLEASWSGEPDEEHLRGFREPVRQGPPLP